MGRRTARGSSTWERRWSRLFLAALVLLILRPAAACGSESETARLFWQARFSEAAEAASGLGGSSDADNWPEDALWRLQLETDPEQALALIAELATLNDMPAAVKVHLALEAAAIQYARGRYQAALAPLADLLAAGSSDLPGEVFLLAGLAHRGLQQIQQSREAWATVKRDDPAFCWARYCLGQAGLESGDVALALRYFASGDQGELAGRFPSLLAGTWEGLRRAGRLEEAESLAATILTDFPQSLAALRVQEVLGREEPPGPGIPTEPPTSAGSGPDQPAAGTAAGFCLQLAAFSDRGRALTFLASWQETLPDLRIAEETGPDERLLYKVRTGQFISRAQARTAAQRLERAHGLEVIVVESKP